MTAPTRKQLVKDLYFTVHGNATNFNAQLFRLIMKADRVNRGRIKAIYPQAVNVWQEWNDAKDEKVFFDRYLLELDV